MVGYGPEDEHYALELTFNYGVDVYTPGQGLQRFVIHIDGAAEAIERKLRSGRAAPDLIVEVRDARLPISSANPALAEAGRLLYPAMEAEPLSPAT